VRSISVQLIAFAISTENADYLHQQIFECKMASILEKSLLALQFASVYTSPDH
jgi:hypothetical protein